MMKLFYMKRILLFVFVTVWISSVFTFCATRTYSSENGAYVSDTLVKSGNRFVGLSFGDGGTAAEVSSLEQAMLITVCDNVPVDTCVIVDNYNDIWAKGENIYVMFGADTLCFNAWKLPREINLMNCFVANRGWKNHRFSHTFDISDAACDCDFFFQAYLPSEIPAWTKRIMKDIMANDIAALFSDDKDRTDALRRIDVGAKTPKQIAAHYAKEHERLYRKEFDVADEEGKKWGPKYDYLFKMNPAYECGGRYITYRFYTYRYTMGAHGYMEEYYLTFDKVAGRLLGAEDIIEPKNFDFVIESLEQKICNRKRRNGETNSNTSADLASLGSDFSTVLKESVKGKIYPRPALTENGLVFSYQPYENGAFAEGIIHFVIPYSEIANVLKIEI